MQPDAPVFIVKIGSQLCKTIHPHPGSEFSRREFWRKRQNPFKRTPKIMEFESGLDNHLCKNHKSQNPGLVWKTDDPVFANFKKNFSKVPKLLQTISKNCETWSKPWLTHGKVILQDACKKIWGSTMNWTILLSKWGFHKKAQKRQNSRNLSNWRCSWDGFGRESP